jgi:hypothetical protein
MDSPVFPRCSRLAHVIPRAWDPAALRVVLADHTKVDPPDEGEEASRRLPPELARELTATCIHTPAYGTRSSSLLAIERGRTLAYLHADGPPCTTAFVDRTELLHG